MKAVIDEVTRWLDRAEEGDWMMLPGIAGRRGRRCGPRTLLRAGHPLRVPVERESSALLLDSLRAQGEEGQLCLGAWS